MNLPPLPRWVKVITCALIIAFIGIGIAARVSDSNSNDNSETAVQSSRPQVLDWAVWDGEGEAPHARIIIQNGNANREYGLGSIHGAAYNATGEKLGYIQVSYGIYNEAGSKVGSCLANETNLGVDTTWEYEAICGSLPNGSLSFGVDDVTYW